ncbi:unnamed protein product, partial [Staurois parvus]
MSCQSAPAGCSVCPQTFNHLPSGRCIQTAGQSQSRGGLPFINCARHFGLCALLGSAQHRDLQGRTDH